MKSPIPLQSANHGFALVVTLTLMVLLSILALGMLSLSTISLRVSHGEMAMQVARSNARVALKMAIDDLQKYAGDDRRITVAADQMRSSGGDGTSAAQGRRFWTGVYRAWEPDISTDASAWQQRPDPASNFLGWLVSPPGLTALEDATNPASVSVPVRLVGEGSAGSDPLNWVEAGTVPVKKDGMIQGNIAWWVGDQGVKSSLSITKPPAPGSEGDARLMMQSAPSGEFRTLIAESNTPFSDSDFTSAKLAALTNFAQSEHLVASSDRPVVKELFHDIAITSSGLMTNVRRGGFRKDLSMYLEKSSTSQQRDTLAEDILYEVPSENGVASEPGINMEELAAFYKLHTQLVPGGGNFTTDGAVLPSSSQTLRFASTPDGCEEDYFHYFKQPIPIAYDSFFSLEAKPVDTPANEPQLYNINMVVDPVVIMWNPLDVAVSIPAASVPSIKYWTSPFTAKVVMKSGQEETTRICHLHGTLSTGDHNYMSLDLTESGSPLVFRPGEVMMVSQTSKANRSQNPHQIAGGPGFSFQNGFSVPLQYGESKSQLTQVTAKAGDTMEITMVRNNYANQKSGGNRLFPGFGGHSRWYSLMHNEIYLGRDRPGGGGQSLPIGGVYLDGDLSKVRLKRDDPPRVSSTSREQAG